MRCTKSDMWKKLSHIRVRRSGTATIGASILAASRTVDPFRFAASNIGALVYDFGVPDYELVM